MKKRYGMMLLALMMSVFLLTACQTQPTEEKTEQGAKVEVTEEQGETTGETEQMKVKDLLGREVEIGSKIEKVGVVGVGALRLYAYAGPLDKLVGVEQVEKGKETAARPYTQINKEIFASLPVIGQGGPKNAPEAERIVELKPDLIITTFTQEEKEADELQSKTGIPVLVISYGKNAIFGDEVKQSIELIGKVMGSQEKADQANAFIQQCKEDLDQRTKGIAEDERIRVYVGGLGSKGAHGIESSQGKYPLLDSIRAVNVVDDTQKVGSVMIDKEQLLEWNPEYIFIDSSGLQIMMEDYAKAPEFYQSLEAVKNKKIFRQMQYNQLTTNIDTALVDMYFIGKTIYPDAFADVEIEKKADEIYTSLLGKPYYNEMMSHMGGFGNIEFP